MIVKKGVYMRRIIMIALSAILHTLSADVTTNIPLPEEKNEYRVNTADYYSWNTRTEIYSFKHVKVSEFSHLLRGCISAYGRIQINDKLNMIVITDETNKLKDILSLCEKLDIAEMNGFEKIQSEAIPVIYNKASNILPFIQSFLSIEGSIKANDKINFISITDHPDVIERIKSEIVKFDMPPKQIQFKFHIVEVYKNNSKEIGTSWDELFNIVNSQASYNFSENTQKSSRPQDDPYKSTTSNSGYNASIMVNPRAITDFVKMMVDKSAIKLVAENSLLCVNNSSSTFSFHYNGKTIVVTMTPNAINDRTLRLCTKIVSNGEMLLENSTITELGNSNLLLRLSVTDSQKSNRRVPVLGTVLPYLFSKDIKSDKVSSIDIVCTPILQIIKK
jgi:hypothetical protein